MVDTNDIIDVKHKSKPGVGEDAIDVCNRIKTKLDQGSDEMLLP